MYLRMPSLNLPECEDKLNGRKETSECTKRTYRAFRHEDFGTYRF